MVYAQRWLDSEIEDQICLATGWCRERTKDTHEDGKWLGIYEDNGSCLDIIEENPRELNRNRNLVVLETDPLTLTDGTTFIGATCTPACEEELRTRFPDNRLRPIHPIVALRKYTIHVTPYGPPRSHLTLILHRIDWLGKHLQQPCDTLVAITHHKPVLSTPWKLWIIRLESDRACFLKETDPDLAMPSTANRPDEDPASQTNTQMPYGTQIMQPSHGRNPKGHQSPRQMQSLHGGSTPRGATHPVTHDTRRANLLALLPQYKGPADGARPAPPTVPTAPSAGGFARTNDPTAHREIAGPSTTAKTPALPGRPDRFRDDPKFIKPTTIKPREEELDDDEPEWLRGCRPTCGSAIAPTKQRSLLSNAESWLKPEPPHRLPDANIPIDCLRELREQARMKATAAAAAATQESSSQVSNDEDEELPDADVVVNVENAADAASDAGDEPTTTQMTWSESPEPEPPKLPERPGLPPDSSLGDRRVMDTGSVQDKQDDRSTKPDPVPMDSSNETADLPSSPPMVPQNNDSDEEMELDVPRGLEDIPPDSARNSVPVFVRPASVVQVKETPYAKGKSNVAVPPTRKETSSGESKTSTSISVVYCTHKDQNSSGDRAAVGNVAVTLAAALETSGNIPKATTRVDTEVQSPTTASKNLKVKFGDVQMEDSPPNISKAHEPGHSPHQALGVLNIGHDKTAALPEPSPVSAQRPPPNLSSSSERAPEIPPPSPNEPLKTPLIVPEMVHTKRKLEASPSKTSNRLSKRREIKIVGFAGNSPPRDTAAELRQARKESLIRFREERQNGSVDANRFYEPRSSEVQRSTTPGRMHGDSHAGAGTDQPQPSPHAHDTRDQNLPEDGRQPAENQILSRADDFEERPGFDHPSTSAAPLRETYPVKMEIDDSPVARIIHNPLPPPQILMRSVHTQQSPRAGNVFQIFRATYPEYTGTPKQFIAQCKQMHKLDLEDKMAPKWQWDDFIIRNRTDYRDYTLQCLEEGEDPEPYYRFYKDNIQDTLYKEGIVKSRKTLEIAVAETEASPYTSSTATAGAPTQYGALDTEPLPVAPRQWPDVVSTRGPSRTSLARGPSQLKRSFNESFDGSFDDSPRRPLSTVKPKRAPEPLPDATPAKKPSRKSLSWGPSHSNKSFDESLDGSADDRPRRPLPTIEANVAPVPSPDAILAKKPSRKSLPWGPSKSNKSLDEGINSTIRNRPRQSLPIAPPKVAPVPRTTSPLGRPQPHSSTSKPAPAKARNPATESRTSTPLSRPSPHGSTAKRSLNIDDIPAEPTGDTGDAFRDFVFAWQRTTSLTGSTEAAEGESWPSNLAVRRKAEVPRPKGYDVLGWKDEL